MPLTERAGLAVLGTSGNKVWYRDLNQIQHRTLAIGHTLAGLLGGEGIHTGGARLLADIADGTDYPPFRACLDDGGGETWWIEAAAAIEMTFAAATIADATAYLVLRLVSGAATDMALGGRADFTIEVQATSDPAPEHSLALGSGAVASSAFTSWTPASVFVDTLERNGTPITVGSTVPGSPSAGDLWWDTAHRMLWTYDGTVSAWLGPQTAWPFGVNKLPPYTSSNANVALLRLPSDWDIYVDQVDLTAYGNAGTWDASNKWTANLLKVGTAIDAVDIDTAGLSHLTIPVGGVIDVSSFPYLRIDVVETGSPGDLVDFLMATAAVRLVRT